MRQPISFFRQLMSVESLWSMRTAIVLDPHYQRQGDVWPTDKQRLLIDSVLNGFLIPPMYWHALGPESEYFDGRNRYAVIDGRQRLETLFAFLDGSLALSPDNSLLTEPDLDLQAVTLTQMRAELPWLYGELMRTQLEVVIIETEEVDLIEELFSRLNEGVPLKAAEKRNRGRVLAPRVRALTGTHPFFMSRLPFGNKRYRHYDLLAKFMRLEERTLREGRVPNVRKDDLDRLFERLIDLEKEGVDRAEAVVDDLLLRVEARLNHLTSVFRPSDPFLGSVGMVTIYYALDRFLEERGQAHLDRSEVEAFERLRQAIKGKEESSLTEDERAVLEFAAYAQGVTSGTYLSARLRILARVLRRITID